MSAHHDEQQDIENAKHLWNKGGKWIFVALVAAALGYLGNVIYQGQVASNNEKAATLAMQVKGDSAKLTQLQQEFGKTAATAQTTLQTANQWFNTGKVEEAKQAYQWILSNHKEPVFQVAAMQNLANILLQEKKYDEALAILATSVPSDFEPVIQEVKGDIYLAQGKNAEAKQAYEAVLAKLPEDSPARELVELKVAPL